MIGLSLEGGGARGAYQAGAAKAFNEKGIVFQGVTGTSIGSINGAMIAQGEFDELWSIWDNISMEKMFNMKEGELEDFKILDLDLEEVGKKLRKAADLIKEGGIDISMAQKILDDHIKEEKIRERGIDFGIVTFSLTEMKAIEIFIQEIPKGELKNYLLASSALPHFKLDKINGIKYLDGGVYNSIPTDLLINKGYKEIWEFRLNSFGRKKNLDLKGKNITLNYIEPKESLGGYLDFNNDTAKRQLRMGYYDALKKLDGLMGNFYYIEKENKEDFFIDLLKNVPGKIILEFVQALNLFIEPTVRSLFEEVVPRVAELLDLDKNASYEEIVINFLEVQAMELEIERFKIYQFKDFFNEIVDKSKTYKDKEQKNNKVIEFFLKNELLSKVNREKNIRHLGKIVIKGMEELYEKDNRLGEGFITGGISDSSSEGN